MVKRIFYVMMVTFYVIIVSFYVMITIFYRKCVFLRKGKRERAVLSYIESRNDEEGGSLPSSFINQSMFPDINVKKSYRLF